jgi:predicted outer membrane repeat protein
VSGDGGAIDNRGALSLSDSRLRFNLARFGGGLHVSGAGATAGITHTEFLSNTANDVGGGLYAFGNTTTVTLLDSSFDGNQSLGRGGGLGRTNAHLTIARSSFTHNTAASGGGLYVQGLSSPDSAGYVEVRDSTFSGNTASAQHSGGIEDNGLLDLRNVTLKGNQYGLYIEDGLDGAGARLQSTVLDNSAANCDGTGTTPSSGGHNLSSDGNCGLSAPDGDQSNVPAGLGPLARDPGGLTYFHLPLLGSLLINQGGPGCSAIDQRGATRPDACDVGAVEFGGLLPRIFAPLMRK